MSAATIYFATNRVEDASSEFRFGNGYNAHRPQYYRVGEAPVSKVGDPWRNADKAFRCGPPTVYPETAADPQAGAAELPGSTALFEAMRVGMVGERRDAIFHLHGFACDFPTAMERAAEIRNAYMAPSPDRWGDLAGKPREPLVFSFSWPSDGEVVFDARRRWAYDSDAADARGSGVAIARCMARLLDYMAGLPPEALAGQRLHLLAHSMGAQALQSALQELRFLNAAGERDWPLFHHAFLMCPDIGHDALEHEHALAPLTRLARHVHVYHAYNDTPLSISQTIRLPLAGFRMGHHGPKNISVLPDTVHAIDCQSVSYTPALHGRHQYYRLAPEVVQDVRAVLAGTSPGEMAWRVREGENRYRIRHDLAARDKLRGKTAEPRRRRRSGRDI